ncbi:MAG: protein kinase [Candidatus Riflebacteria bacterium]|nr:protein kinase [Candidatus Riflebacteria bacterium]
MEGGYELLEILGRGGLGVVYRAVQQELGREVALKMPHDGVDISPLVAARFRREVEAMAALNHPNIVRVFDFGVTPAGKPYFAMELLDARDLASILRDGGRLSYQEISSSLGQAAAALAHVHERRMVHRDVKPSNLMLDASGHLKLMDFGLVRTDSNTLLTVAGERLGTLRYMAPEALGDAALDRPELDIYGLGVSFWEAVAGRPAHEGSAPHAILASVLQGVRTPIQELRPDAPGWLCELISRSVSLDPAVRPSAGTIAATCRRRSVGEARKGRGTATHPRVESRAGDPAALGRPSWRIALVALVVLVALVLTVALLGVFRFPGPVPGPPSPGIPRSGAAPSAIAGPLDRSRRVAMVRNFHLVPSDDGVLVDFDLPGEMQFTVQILESSKAGPVTAGARTSRGATFRHLFRNLKPQTLYHLRLSSRDGRPAMADYPFRTRTSEDRTVRDLWLLELDPSGPQMAGALIGPPVADPAIEPAAIRYCRRYPGKAAQTLGTFVSFAEELRSRELAELLVPLIPQGQHGLANLAARLSRTRSERAALLARKAFEGARTGAAMAAAAQALAAGGQADACDLIAGRQDRSADWWLVPGTLIGCDPGRARHHFRRWLDQPGPYDRPRTWALLKGLALLGEPDDLRVLESELSRTGGVASSGLAALALALAAGPGARESLRAALTRASPAPDVMLALGLCGTAVDAGLAETALSRSGDPGVRWSAAVALGNLGSSGSGRCLERALDDTDATVRAAACWALGRLGFQPAAPRILERFTGGALPLCAAAGALGQLRYRPAAALLESLLAQFRSTSEVGSEQLLWVALGLARIQGPAALPRLRAALGSPGRAPSTGPLVVSILKEVGSGPESTTQILSPQIPFHRTGITVQAGDWVLVETSGSGDRRPEIPGAPPGNARVRNRPVTFWVASHRFRSVANRRVVVDRPGEIVLSPLDADPPSYIDSRAGPSGAPLVATVRSSALGNPE